MQVKNKQSGEVEAMRYGMATAAVAAGTHEHVNVDDGSVVDDVAVENDGTVDLDKITKDELLAEAEKRGVEVKASDTKAEILTAFSA